MAPEKVWLGNSVKGIVKSIVCLKKCMSTVKTTTNGTFRPIIPQDSLNSEECRCSVLFGALDERAKAPHIPFL